jgi:hypothetical protein
MYIYFILFYNSKMKLSYINITYFLYYQKITFLYSDLQCKKPNKLPVLSYLQPNLYKWKAPVVVYNKNIIAPIHVNTNINTYINKYITNKL